MLSTSLPEHVESGLIECGHFGKTVGLRGDIRFFPSSGQLDTIAQLKAIYIDLQTTLQVKGVQVRQDFLVLSITNHPTVESVGYLVNKKAYLKKSDLPKLSKGSYYWFELLSLEVIHAENQSLGYVQRIYSNGPQDILCTSGGQQVPFVFGEVIKKVSLNDGKIYVDFDVAYFQE